MKTIHKTLQIKPDSIENVVNDLSTVCDFVRYGATRFAQSDLYFGHGTDSAFDESAFLILETLHLPVDSIEPYWNARLTQNERAAIASLIDRRCSSRKPAPYLVNKAYIQSYPFYVDERVIIPRSFIAEILCKPDGFSKIPDYNDITNVLDLCTGSGCLGIIAADIFPNAHVDCVDISQDALDVAVINVKDYGFEDRVTLYHGDLFSPVAGKQYDLIITNPPYVDKKGMDTLPEEFHHEPALALAAGDDGLDIVHRIIKDAKKHLKDGGGMLCELGRCGPDLEVAYPKIPFLWIETQTTSNEVFWINKKDLT